MWRGNAGLWVFKFFKGEELDVATNNSSSSSKIQVAVKEAVKEWGNGNEVCYIVDDMSLMDDKSPMSTFRLTG